MPMADVKVYDTLSSKKILFKSMSPHEVRIYGCGPTVYGYAHVGNARAVLTQDLVVRVLKYAGYKVVFARNYTDVDDKIIQRAAIENKTALEVAEFYTKVFDQNMKDLDIAPPDHAPKVTESIPAIIDMIRGLEKNKIAYAVEGNVYYRVEKFSKYGCLSHRQLKDMISGVRIDPGEHKENPADFALWKAAKPGDPFWESPWGKGRPGWHIECSAMIHEIFKGPLDIHMGGLDLIFPHHENEIAQSEGFSGKPLANYWIHNGMLEVGHEKMSKSLGNLMTISDFVPKYGAECLRILFAQNHYHGPLEFSVEAIIRAEALVDRLYLCKQNALNPMGDTNKPIPQELNQLVARIDECFFDDFNSAKALGLILAAARVCFRENSPAAWKAWAPCLQILNDVLSVAKKDPTAALKENRERKLMRMNVSAERSQEIERKLLDRIRLREEKKFKEADQVRSDLEAKGIVVMDGPDGVSWTVQDE